MFGVVGTGLWVRSGLFFPNFFIVMTNFKQSSVIQFASFIAYFTVCCYCCSVTCCLCPTLCDTMEYSMYSRLPCPLLSLSLFKLMSIVSTMSSSLLILSPTSPAVRIFSLSGSFPVSHFFTSGGQSIGASASASVLPMNIQG